MPLTNQEIIRRLRGRDLHVYGNLSMLMDMCIALSKDVDGTGPEDIGTAIKNAHIIKAIAAQEARADGRFADLWWKSLLLLAPYDFDSFMLYMERERPARNRFYLPRRQQLIKIGAVQLLQDMEDDKVKIGGLSVVPGAGKAQPMDSKVLTPEGFRLMGEISVGDKVISGAGSISTVLGVYPQGKRKIYELTFDDGSRCRCSDEHLWECQSRADRRAGKKKVIPFSEMMAALYAEHGKRSNYSIDYVSAVDFPEKNLPIHPYVLGALIGNGDLTGGTVRFSTADNETLERVMSFLPARFCAKYISGVDYRLVENVDHRDEKTGRIQKCFLRRELERLELFEKRSHEKHIPDAYKYASKEQRLWLLRGLMDTDGYAGTKSCEYSTCSATLAHDVIDLVHSLGGYASVAEKETHYTLPTGQKIECKKAFRVVIQFSKNDASIFALTRKREKYKPRREKMLRFLKKVEYVGEEECQCIYIDNPSHLYVTDDYIVTHNTTLGEFYLAWIIGRHENDYNIFASHSGGICRMFYDAVDALTGTPEYKFAEIFPAVHRYSTNAKELQINFGKYKPFKSLSCVSVGQNLAGRVRANRLLYCDDLVPGIEVAVSRPRLDKLWQAYTVDLLQRRIDKCKELHVATRWSVADPIGRIMQKYQGDPMARFIAVPDIDPETGESNFNYKYGVGFSKEYFQDMEATIDSVTYRCLYKNEPVEREGLLYPEDSLRRYMTLPEGEPDAILGVCDTKNTGTDFMFLPVFCQYGGDYFMVDCICDDCTDFDVQYNRLAELIISTGLQRVEFETNNGGGRIAHTVAKMIEGKSRCAVTEHYTTQNKETKIIVRAEWIKKHVLFKDPSMYAPKSDYGKAMGFLSTYTTAGKNAHDDVPDGMAQFVDMIDNLTGRETEVIESPF